MSDDIELQQGLEMLNLTIPTAPLLHYLTLMQTWNKAFNLTAIKDTDRVRLHLLDSLAILPWVQGPYVIDVGTGAGLPGIPLAIARPDTQFVLLDSNGKKIRFLSEVKRVLRLCNLEIVQSRVEDYHPHNAFNTVISRAFSELKQMLTWTQHLIHPEGIWLAMKGRYPTAEIAAIEKKTTIHSYTVPFVEGERCCVVMRPLA